MGDSWNIINSSNKNNGSSNITSNGYNKANELGFLLLLLLLLLRKGSPCIVMPSCPLRHRGCH